MELRYSFDPERFYLGTLCKRGHAWPGTQQSLRLIYKDKRGRTVNHCVGCKSTKGDNWLHSWIDHEAMGLETGQTLGKLCSEGHRWNGLDVSIRSHGHCIECERLRKIERSRSRPRKTERRWIPELRGIQQPTERRRLYKRMMRERLREQGLTAKGTTPVTVRILGCAENARLQRALRAARRCPSVARLVMEEQKRYWREHPETKREHDKQWARDSWWLEYQINPDLRLYVRQKSKRRKALLRQQTAHQIKPRLIRARFAQFDNCCAYCGATGDMQIEHVVPISKGGTHAMGNIVPACRECNYSKREHEVERWYRSQPQFSEKRWRKICRVLGWDRGSVGQLALL